MYFKILEMFLLKTLFQRDEYKITSKHFNPFRLILIMLLVANVFFTVYLLNKMGHIYNDVSGLCPEFFDKTRHDEFHTKK